MIPKIESVIISDDKKNQHVLIYKITTDKEHDAVSLQKAINDYLKVTVIDSYHGDSKYT